jgi:hypothetical protein
MLKAIHGIALAAAAAAVFATTLSVSIRVEARASLPGGGLERNGAGPAVLDSRALPNRAQKPG